MYGFLKAWPGESIPPDSSRASGYYEDGDIDSFRAFRIFMKTIWPPQDCTNVSALYWPGFLWSPHCIRLYWRCPHCQLECWGTRAAYTLDYPPLRQIRHRRTPNEVRVRGKGTDFLGHHISDKGIWPLDDKVQALQDFPRPTFQRKLQKFLGLINFYHRFLNHGAAILKGRYCQICSKKFFYIFLWIQVHKKQP